jgi:glycosyltransferase involved in cell wall biosynthesis
LNVSVIIPTTGRESLDDSIKSVIRQSEKVLEIIVVDDSASQLVQHSDCLVIRTGGSRGVSYARNLGTRSAKGDTIAFLDDDDTWERDKIRNQLEEMVSRDLDVLISSAEVNGKVRPSGSPLLRLNQDPFSLLYSKPHLLRSKAYLPTASYIIRKSVFKAVQFDENLIERENLLFIFQCYKKNLRISQSSEVLIQINYKKKNSLSRMSIEIEKSWFTYLQSLNKDYAQNFSIESARNFVRRKEYNAAKEMLHLNHNPNLTSKTFYFLVLLLSMMNRSRDT